MKILTKQRLGIFQIIALQFMAFTGLSDLRADTLQVNSRIPSLKLKQLGTNKLVDFQDAVSKKTIVHIFASW